MNPYFAITMENQGQWTRVHTHESTTFVQVTGRKGWLFGDSLAFEQTDQILSGEGDMKAAKGPIKDSILGIACHLILGGITNQALTVRKSHV